MARDLHARKPLGEPAMLSLDWRSARNAGFLQRLDAVPPACGEHAERIGESCHVNALHALRVEPAPASTQQPALRDYVAKAVRRYLLDLGQCDSHELYDIVLREIEKPMLAEVMRHCEGNQSRAAAVLGLNRATLRKKLRTYGLA